MNRNLHFIATIHFLITTTTCSAMEDKPKILFELATAADEDFAALISNNRCIINGKKNCQVINIITNEPVFTIENTHTNNAYNCIDLHPNRECFALSDKDKITIYDIKTGLEKCTTQHMGSCAPLCMFNPSEDTLFVWPPYKELIQYHYNTNSVLSTGICSPTGRSSIAVHPTKQQICVQANYKVSLYDYDQHDYDQQKNVYTITKDLTDFIKPGHFFKYSPNGSFIVTISNCNSIKAINPDDNTQSLIIDQLPSGGSTFEAIEFHPNNTVLAAFLLKDRYETVIMRYLNSTKQQIIAETSLSGLSNSSLSPTYRALSFSPDGTKIGIKLNDKFIVLPVPFEVIYQPKTNERMFLIHEILEYYNLPPQDIMPSLLEAFKR